MLFDFLRLRLTDWLTLKSCLVRASPSFISIFLEISCHIDTSLHSFIHSRCGRRCAPSSIFRSRQLMGFYGLVLCTTIHATFTGGLSQHCQECREPCRYRCAVQSFQGFSTRRRTGVVQHPFHAGCTGDYGSVRNSGESTPCRNACRCVDDLAFRDS